MDDTSKNCKLCKSLVPGCIECHNTTGATGAVKCSQCMIGYYHDLTGQCKLCSSNNKGSVSCIDENHCIECQSLYFLSSNATHAFCKLCSTPISHCDICNASTQCIQCASSFFLSTSKQQCKFCSQYIENCIYCEDESTCILCDTEYFIQNGHCEKCSSHISGCYSCTDSTYCTACKNGYVYDPNTTSCKTLSLTAPQPAVKTLKLKSYYEGKQKLRHVLFSQGMKFNKSTTEIQTLMKKISIVMKDKALAQYQLVIKSWQLSRDQYSIVFFTNNLIDFNGLLEKNSTKYKMQFRLLLEKDLSDLNIDTDLKIPKDLSKQLLPQLDYNSDVSVNYNLNQPEFYNSLMLNSQFFQSKYYIFGYVVLSVLFINFLVKVIFTGKGTLNYGQIVPHIVAIKTVGIAVYPGHFEMISFCKGFMLYDIPWLNGFFGSIFGSSFDYETDGYKLFYTNLNIGSTYFIALISLILSVILDRVFLRKKVQNKKQKQQDEQRSEIEGSQQKLNRWFKGGKNPLQPTKFQTFYTSIFGFSIVQVSLCSLIGAIYSDFPEIGVNLIMHLIGSCIYFILLIHIAYVSFMNFAVYSNNLRTFIKSTVLSLSYLAPIYLVVVTFLIDCVLLIVQYKLSPYGVKNNGSDKQMSAKKLFFISQFLANLTILFVFFINSRLICFVVAVLLITICVFIELFLHNKEYKSPYQAPKRLYQTSKQNMMFTDNEQLSQSNAYDPFKTKLNFNETNYSNGFTTIAPKKTLRQIKNPKSLARSQDVHKRDKNQGFFNDI